MFKLQDGREHLYQWDINRRVIVEDPTIDEVHFCNKTDDCSLVVKTYTDDTYDGKVYADIPNILLQNDFPIRVYAYCNDGYTKIEECFKVKSRTRPSDYVYEETEVIRIEELLDKAEQAITTAAELTEYFDTHKLDFTDDGEGNVTLEGVVPEGGSDADLSNYYNKAETNALVEKAIEGIQIPEPDLTGYATQQFVLDKVADIDIPTIPTNVSVFNNDAGYLTEHQSLDGYAKTTDIPDVSKYQTADQVTALINEALGVIENGSY